MKGYASVPEFNDYEGLGGFFSQLPRMLGQVLRRTKHCCHSRNLCLELSLDGAILGYIRITEETWKLHLGFRVSLNRAYI